MPYLFTLPLIPSPSSALACYGGRAVKGGDWVGSATAPTISRRVGLRLARRRFSEDGSRSREAGGAKRSNMSLRAKRSNMSLRAKRSNLPGFVKDCFVVRLRRTPRNDGLSEYISDNCNNFTVLKSCCRIHHRLATIVA
jgi:hypothetical protein